MFVPEDLNRTLRINLAISEIHSNQRLVSVGSHLERTIRDKWI